MKLNVEVSRKIYELYQSNARIKVAYSGRAAQKSYGFADMALQRMIKKRTDIATCREYKSTIKTSVHKLLKERIDYHNLQECFDITDNTITYLPNGSKVIYQHLHNNFTEVRGLEGIDVCWIFEGHDLQRESWEVLNPTIRRTPRMTQDPEIWIEFNPQFEDDFVYTEFVSKSSPDCLAVYTSYLENRWCPDDLIALADKSKRDNPDEYRHIWLGHPRNVGLLVYPQFDYDIHVREVDMPRIEHVANFFMGQDPHTVYYPACVWIGRMPRGDGSYDYYVYNEWPLRSTFDGQLYHKLRKDKKCTLTLKQRARIYKLLDNTVDETYHGISIAARGIDTRFAKGAGAPSTTSNTKGIIREMADTNNGGLSFETPPEYMIDSQRDRIRDLLYWDTDQPRTAFNEPRIYFLPHCENMIDTLRFHRFDKDGKEREDERRKDFGDALKIVLATEQQHKHADRSISTEVEYVEETDRVADLQEQFLGHR